MHVEELKEKLEKWPYPLITEYEILDHFTSLGDKVIERTDKLEELVDSVKWVLNFLETADRSDIRQELYDLQHLLSDIAKDYI